MTQEAQQSISELVEMHKALLASQDARERHAYHEPNLQAWANAVLRAMLVIGNLSQNAAASDVLAERRRQLETEGWTSEHDDTHDNGEMARAAGVYSLIAGADATNYRNARDGYSLGDYLQAIMDHYWPWDRSWFKATNRRRDLVKAGALILAEIERLDRLAAAVDRPTVGDFAQKGLPLRRPGLKRLPKVPRK